MFGSQCAQRPWPSRWAPLGTPQLTPGEEHGVQPQAGSALQAGGQLREVVAVEVEDDPQRLPTALNVVEDAGVCGRTRQGGGSPPRPEGSPAPPSPGQLHPCLQTPRWRSGASLFSPPQRSSLRMPSYLQRGIPGLPCLPTPEHWSASPLFPPARASLGQPRPPTLRRAASDFSPPSTGPSFHDFILGPGADSAPLGSRAFRASPRSLYPSPGSPGPLPGKICPRIGPTAYLHPYGRACGRGGETTARAPHPAPTAKTTNQSIAAPEPQSVYSQAAGSSWYPRRHLLSL